MEEKAAVKCADGQWSGHHLHHHSRVSQAQSWPRRVFRVALGLLTVAVCGATLNHRHLWTANSPKSIQERVDLILSETPLIDGHNDLPDVIRSEYRGHIYSSDFTKRFTEGNLTGHVDIPRLSKGRVGGTFWSVYVDCPDNVTDFSNENYAESVRRTFEQVDLVRRLQQAFPYTLSGPVDSSSAMDAFRSGQIISPLGMEGLHSIGNTFAHLRAFHSLGVRYATLAHYCHNLYADAAVVNSASGGVEVPEPLHGGVSELGKEAVREMNRLGVMVDLAHVSHDTMRDVLGRGKDSWSGSRAPVIFSHSSAYSLCPHPRNVPDDVLRMVKETGSTVMVTFVPSFISCAASEDPRRLLPVYDPEHSTLARVVDHIMHIGDMIGYDHVGLGSDFDGIPTTPEGLDDVEYFPAIIEELIRRGVSDRDAGMVAGGSLLRTWAKVDEVAQEMQRDGALPAEDDDELL